MLLAALKMVTFSLFIPLLIFQSGSASLRSVVLEKIFFQRDRGASKERIEGPKMEHFSMKSKPGEEPAKPKMEEAIFAGGCFWCLEEAFERLPGVEEVVSGYTGGHVPNPSYEEVSTGSTGHREAVRITFDSTRISFERLLEVFWKYIDPTDAGGQFADRGNQYRTAIFYLNEKQKGLTEESLLRLEQAQIFEARLVTEILPAKAFYPAEAFHQEYYVKFPKKYANYKQYSGRISFVRAVWEEHQDFRLFPERQSYWLGYVKPSDEELRHRLTPLQYKVTQKNGTEPPFQNAYVDNKKEGIYVDVVSGEPLFSSREKFDSGSGWPSFTRPLEPKNILEREDASLSVPRTEVRSRRADSHLGHVFEDGPPPAHRRFCINSAALRFIPVEEFTRKGYGAYRKLFQE